MIEILRLSDLAKITHYPYDVVETIRQTVINMDSVYGSSRTSDGDGGIELIVESEDELHALLQTLPFGDIPESVEIVHQDFLHAIYLSNNERSVDVFLPKEWATKNMLEVL